MKNVSQLKPDEERRKRVAEYVNEMVSSSKDNTGLEGSAKAEDVKFEDGIDAASEVVSPKAVSYRSTVHVPLLTTQ